jgi:hypothetical protein
MAVGYFFVFRAAHYSKKEADPMAEKRPSKQKQEASAAQSLADRTGVGTEEARRMQSEADQSDVTKHGQ